MKVSGKNGTGLGGPEEVINGKSTGSVKLDKLINQAAKECYELFFKGTRLDYKHIAAVATTDSVTFGIEPSYKDEELKIIVLHSEIGLSNLTTGIARGLYGSQWQATNRYYDDYKRSSKFTRFVEKWQPQLFKEEAWRNYLQGNLALKKDEWEFVE